MSENDETTKETPVVVPAEARGEPEAAVPPAELRKPAPRVFARTRFPKLPVLSEKELAKLAPHHRAEFLRQKKHEDDWGHLPPQIHELLRGVDPKDIAKQSDGKAVELHAKTRDTDPVHFAAAKSFHKWAMHHELSLDEYDAAIEAVLSTKHGC